MKKSCYVLFIFLFPLFVFSQNVQVLGGIIADSINVNSGHIRNLGNPVSGQDAATKSYVDNNDAVIDADADVTNEIQDLNLVDNILTITNNGAATDIDLSSYLDNTDSQIVTLFAIDGSNILTITLEDGNSKEVDLSAYLDDTVLSEAQVDAYADDNGYLTIEIDGSVTNEIQDISTDNTPGNITLSDGSTLNLNVTDGDANSMNELQQLSINEDTIFIENGNYIIVDGLAKINVIYNLSIASYSVQQRLDAGETPISIYSSDNSLLDSLYGKTYQGGLICHLNTFNGTGLIAALNDQSTGAEWGCIDTLIGGTSNKLATGQANTSLIIAGCGETGIAAEICNDLDNLGYDDWFLPSKDELNTMYFNLKFNGYGNFDNDIYWSSTEKQADQGKGQDFDSGVSDNYSKDSSKLVRAVRAF